MKSENGLRDKMVGKDFIWNLFEAVVKEKKKTKPFEICSVKRKAQF